MEEFFCENCEEPLYFMGLKDFVALRCPECLEWNTVIAQIHHKEEVVT